MPDKVVIRDLGAMQEHKGGFGPSEAEFEFGNLAVDVLGHATAEDMLSALRLLVPIETAKAIVEMLLDNGLLFDTLLEADLRNGEADDAR